MTKPLLQPLHGSFILAALSHFSVLQSTTLLEYFYVSIFLRAQKHCGLFHKHLTKQKYNQQSLLHEVQVNKRRGLWLVIKEEKNEEQKKKIL